jgi:hypothetical protein
MGGEILIERNREMGCYTIVGDHVVEKDLMKSFLETRWSWREIIKK